MMRFLSASFKLETIFINGVRAVAAEDMMKASGLVWLSGRCFAIVSAIRQMAWCK